METDSEIIEELKGKIEKEFEWIKGKSYPTAFIDGFNYALIRLKYLGLEMMNDD